MPRLDPTARAEYQRQYALKRRQDPEWRARDHAMTDYERFWSKVDRTSTCWLWTGGFDQHGYGRARLDGRQKFAHRMSYEALVAPIPSGLVLDHLCRVRNCVNPAHLEPVTSRENTFRGDAAPARLNAEKTHCKHGHEFTPENTRISGRTRLCRACARRHTAQWRAKAAS